jgi:hypothetical protein
MIENFLTFSGAQGALAGSKPRDAFFVKVGLGETMTALDILEGRMIVEIGMAAVRPGGVHHPALQPQDAGILTRHPQPPREPWRTIHFQSSTSRSNGAVRTSASPRCPAWT